MHKYTARTTIYWAKPGLLSGRPRLDNRAPSRRYGGQRGSSSVVSAGTKLTLWGPGFRPDPFPARPGELSFRVTYELGKEAGMSVYVGIDVHRKRSQVAVIEPEGGRCSPTGTCPTGRSRS